MIEILNRRENAILRAVEAGHAELLGGVHPDLLIEGRFCSDQGTVHRLAEAGLIAGATPVSAGHTVPAALTAAARHLLTQQAA